MLGAIQLLSHSGSSLGLAWRCCWSLRLLSQLLSAGRERSRSIFFSVCSEQINLQLSQKQRLNPNACTPEAALIHSSCAQLDWASRLSVEGKKTPTETGFPDLSGAGKHTEILGREVLPCSHGYPGRAQPSASLLSLLCPEVTSPLVWVFHC